MHFTKVKIVTYVPLESSDEVRRALGESGAGKIGNYTFCSFSTVGHGRFTPGDNSSPHIGEVNMPQVVEEERIEVVCDRVDANKIIAALKDVHPYEEVAYEVIPLLSEDQL